jgi:hypothetical protein
MSAYDNPVVQFKGDVKPSSYFKGVGNNDVSLSNSAQEKQGILFKEKFCAPGSECAKSANAVANRMYTDVTGLPFDVEANAHNAWHMEDQMLRHGAMDVTNQAPKVGDRVLMGNGIDQSTYVPGYTADPNVRHAGTYAGIVPTDGGYRPVIFESGKNNPMFLNDASYTFTGPDSIKKMLRPSQFADNTFGEALVDQNIRYAFRDTPSVAQYSSNNQAVQNILTEAEKFREVIKKTHNVTNDEFDELLNNLIGVGAQETKLNGALPGSKLAKAKIELQNQLTKFGLTKPIKQTLNVVKKGLNSNVASDLPAYPGASQLEMEAAKLSSANKIPFEEALNSVKSNYQPKPKYTTSTVEPSKGMFRQKYQTDADKFTGFGNDLKDKNSIANGLGQMSDNYNTIKKLYPDASPRELMDLTTLMWNSPGKAKNKQLVDFYLFGKDNPDPSKFNFDYIRKINSAKDDLINIHPKGKRDPSFEMFRANNYPEIQYKQGGIIKDDRGQWAYPGEITEIGSNNITMQGVPYDVLGISDKGDIKLMKPGKNYKFKGKKVTEFPMAKNGVNQQDEKTFEHLDQLTNFTNYNKPQPGGWLNKYN